jgi:DNA-binding NarL/FixJ family response regulator
MKTRILIADDHKIVQEGMASVISQHPDFEVVGYATNGNEVIKAIPRTSPDIILMDINMPQLDGISTTHILQKSFPLIGVIVLSMHSEAYYIKRAIEAGAQGYLLKTAGKKIVFEAIEAVKRGSKYFPNEIKDLLLDIFQSPTSDVARLEDLTDREKEVLSLISREFSTKEIADKLFISTHTVDTHRKNLLSKLQVKNVVGLARFALQHGLVK